MGYALKPWYTARWETVEPEEESALDEPEYNEPSTIEILNLEYERKCYQ